MTGEFYTVTVYANANDKLHHGGKQIKEVYLAEAGICFNDEGYIFRCNGARCDDSEKISKIEVSDELVDIFKGTLAIQDLTKKEIDKFF